MTRSLRTRAHLRASAAVGLAVVATACGGSSSSSSSSSESSAAAGGAAPAASLTSTAAGSGKVKSGLRLAFFSVGGNNTYLKSGIKGAQEAAAKYGASIKVFDGEFDGAKQLNQVTQAVSSGDYDGIVVEPNNSQQLCSAVKAALAAKLAVGITNVPICDAPYDGVYQGTTLFAGGQSPGVYEQWFKQGFDADPAGGEFAVLNGPATQGNTIRARQVLDKIKGQYPKWKEVSFDYTDYQASVALAKTQTLLQQHPNLKVIFSSYSGHTPGAIAAIKAAGKQSQVKIYDLGGDRTMFDALKSGTIASTLVYLPYEEEYRAVVSVVAQLSKLPELDGVKVGTFWDLTKDPKLNKLPAFVVKDKIADYAAIGLPEY